MTVPSLPENKIAAVEGKPVVLSDGDFVANASFARDGLDLCLTSPDGGVVRIEGYFNQSPPPDIVTGTGAHFTPHLINAFLASSHPGEYAEASTASAPAANDATAIGKITQVVGEATIVHADGTKMPAQVGAPIVVGDVIETSSAGAVNILFADNTTFAISESARLAIDQFTYNAANQSGTSFFSMLQGVFVYTSGLIGKTDPGSVNIETPVGSIGIRGTLVAGDINPSGEDSTITIVDGAIVLTNGAGTVVLNEGFETASISGYNNAPQNIGQIDPQTFANSYQSVSDVTGGLFNDIQDGSYDNDGENGNNDGQSSDSSQQGEGGETSSDAGADAAQNGEGGDAGGEGESAAADAPADSPQEGEAGESTDAILLSSDEGDIFGSDSDFSFGADADSFSTSDSGSDFSTSAAGADSFGGDSDYVSDSFSDGTDASFGDASFGGSDSANGGDTNTISDAVDGNGSGGTPPNIDFHFLPIYLNGTSATGDDGVPLFSATGAVDIGILHLNNFNSTPSVSLQEVTAGTIKQLVYTSTGAGSFAANYINPANLDSVVELVPTATGNGDYVLRLHDPLALLGTLVAGNNFELEITVSADELAEPFTHSFVVFFDHQQETAGFSPANIFIGDHAVSGQTIQLNPAAVNDITMAGSSADDFIWGRGGDDTIEGGGGNDALLGGDGNDTFLVTYFDDTVYASNEFLDLARLDGGDDPTGDTLILGDSTLSSAQTFHLADAGNVTDIENIYFHISTDTVGNSIVLDISDVFGITGGAHNLNVSWEAGDLGLAFINNDRNNDNVADFIVTSGALNNGSTVTLQGMYNGVQTTLNIDQNSSHILFDKIAVGGSGNDKFLIETSTDFANLQKIDGAGNTTGDMVLFGINGEARTTFDLTTSNNIGRVEKLLIGDASGGNIHEVKLSIQDVFEMTDDSSAAGGGSHTLLISRGGSCTGQGVFLVTDYNSDSVTDFTLQSGTLLTGSGQAVLTGSYAGKTVTLIIDHGASSELSVSVTGPPPA